MAEQSVGWLVGRQPSNGSPTGTSASGTESRPARRLGKLKKTKGKWGAGARRSGPFALVGSDRPGLGYLTDSVFGCLPRTSPAHGIGLGSFASPALGLVAGRTPLTSSLEPRGIRNSWARGGPHDAWASPPARVQRGGGLGNNGCFLSLFRIRIRIFGQGREARRRTWLPMLFNPRDRTEARGGCLPSQSHGQGTTLTPSPAWPADLQDACWPSRIDLRCYQNNFVAPIHVLARRLAAASCPPFDCARSGPHCRALSHVCCETQPALRPYSA